MTDLLSGRPYKRILAFCIPLLIGNLFQELYSMADAVIVNQFMGTDAFAAIKVTGALSFLIMGLVRGMCAGFTIPIAQDVGARDIPGVRKAIGSCLWLGSIIAISFSTLMFFATDDLLRLLDTPPELFENAYIYIRIILVGMAVNMLYNTLAGILRALGDSRTPLYFLIVACVLNILLDILCIAVFKMGVAGAAVATLAAQLISGILCLLLRQKFPELRLSKEDLRIHPKHIARLARNGVPMGLQYALTAIGSVIVQRAVNGLGVDAATAMAAGDSVHTVLCLPLDSLGIAVATFVGQNIGAKQFDRVQQGMKEATIVGLIYCVFANALNFTMGHEIASLFISGASEAVFQMTAQLATTYAISYPLLLIIFVFRNAIQGMGYSREAMLAGVFEMAGRIAVIVLFIGTFGYTATCFATPIAWVLASPLLIGIYIIKMNRFKSLQKQM